MNRQHEASVFHYSRLERLDKKKHYSLWGTFLSYQENEVLLIRPSVVLNSERKAFGLSTVSYLSGFLCFSHPSFMFLLFYGSDGRRDGRTTVGNVILRHNERKCPPFFVGSLTQCSVSFKC